MWPSMVTNSRNLCSAFIPSKVHTHSSEHTHTMNTHPEQWAAIYAAVLGEQLGVRCLAQGHLSHGIEGGERAVHSPTGGTNNSCQIWDSNPRPLGYESNSLTIRPRLPHNAETNCSKINMYPGAAPENVERRCWGGARSMTGGAGQLIVNMTKTGCYYYYFYMNNKITI